MLLDIMNLKDIYLFKYSLLEMVEYKVEYLK